MSKTSTAWSSVGKKLLTGLTGLGLVGFVVVHLVGNLTLLIGRGAAFNDYAHFLETVGHGAALPVAEVSLVVLFLCHIFAGLTVYRDKTRARPVSYYKVSNAGGKSRQTVSSQNMIWTGLLLAVFLVIHILQFRLGPVFLETQGSEQVRDLYRVVMDRFHQGAWVAFYVVMMGVLGFHLRHGFWSMFQSLGLNNQRWSLPLFGAGVVVATLLTTGFIILPIYLFVLPANSALGGPLP